MKFIDKILLRFRKQDIELKYLEYSAYPVHVL